MEISKERSQGIHSQLVYVRFTLVEQILIRLGYMRFIKLAESRVTFLSNKDLHLAP